MCGIAGLLHYRGDAEKNIEIMKQRMISRGPDAGGTWHSDDGSVWLGHRRLAIVDLTEGGAQPMLSHSGRYVITYNGEIYNYQELKNKLLEEKKVEGFRSTSDTEILLESIEAYGFEQTLQMAKGMLAIGVYDRKEKTLTLARDRVGEKPLYYGIVDGGFIFSSEIASIKELDGFHNEINTDVMNLYFTYGYIPAPYTIYRGIYKLTPGTYLTVKLPGGGEAFTEAAFRGQEKPYWSMMEAALHGQEHPFTGSFSEAVDVLEQKLKDAIQYQMVADVPVGAFLSAGIDSSTVVALMQDLAPGKVRSFTIGMEDPKYNEATIAKEIAAHLGTDHTELYINEAEAKAVIPLLPDMFGEPFADSSQIPTYLVSKMTKEHVTVSLSGDAGDELFCGYNSYRSMERIWNKLQPIPYSIRKTGGNILSLFAGHQTQTGENNTRRQILHDQAILMGATDPVNLRYREEALLDPLTLQLANTAGYLKNSEAAKVNESEVTLQTILDTLPAGYLKETNHQLMLADMLQYHPDDILVKVDRTAMAVSLETRVPFLDRDVMEFAWSLPINYLRDDQVGKKVLREVLYRHVPKELMDRPKKGFSVPIKKWLKELELKNWMNELLLPDHLKQYDFINSDAIQILRKDFIERDIWRSQLWYTLMLVQWLDNN